METAYVSRNPAETEPLLYPTGQTALRFKTLLVAYDFSMAAVKSVVYAREIAKKFGSKVVLVHIESPSTIGEAMDSGIAELKTERKKALCDLNDVADKLRSSGVEVSLIWRCGPATDVLVSLAASMKPDLLLLGAYGFHLIDRSTLGSTAEFLLRSVPCPTLTIGPSVLEGRLSAFSLGEALFATSVPLKPGKARDLTCALALKFGTRVHITHVEPPRLICEDSGRIRDLEARESRIAQEFRARGVSAAWAVRYGSQNAELLSEARKLNADLIVFGIEHGAVADHEIGFLSSMIRNAPCPVLTVPGPA